MASGNPPNGHKRRRVRGCFFPEATPNHASPFFVEVIMTAGWIKFRKTIIRDGRVRSTARKCNATRVTVVGALVTLWTLADDYADETGKLAGYSPDDVDDEVGVEGFCSALPSDWIRIEGESVYLPNYKEHNGSTAKVRAQGARRTKASRTRNANRNAPTVTEALPDKIRVDKRRVKESTKESASATPSQPTKDNGPFHGPEFTLKDGSTWRVNDDQHQSLVLAFPSIDVDHQLLMASAWMIGLPSRRKTKRGMPRFLFNWMATAQKDSANGGGREFSIPMPPPVDDSPPFPPE